MTKAIAEALSENRPVCMLGSPARQWETFKAAERYMWS